MRRAILICALALLACAAVAIAQDYAGRQQASIEFSTGKPASPATEQISIDYVNPDDPGAKPPAVRKVETVLQGGARFDTTGIEQCTAPDAELMAQGEAACPPESKVGEGVTTVDTGFEGPGRIVEADVDFFNNDHELIFLTTVKPSGAHTVIRADVFKRRTVTEVDMLPGTPPDGGAIDTVSIELGRIEEDTSYITTPPRCPKRRSWVNRIRFTYADGQTQETTNEVPCRKPRKR
jgi:hypothetical protein